ncbi:hypothetical protein BN1183_AB_00710 [Pantoea ananatis]|nr:hypothetical protein BN1183_AB_00710 [Pantoea ananatis]
MQIISPYSPQAPYRPASGLSAVTFLSAFRLILILIFRPGSVA